MKIEDIEIRHVEILSSGGQLIVRGCLALKSEPDVTRNRLKWAFLIGEQDMLLEHLQFMNDH